MYTSASIYLSIYLSIYVYIYIYCVQAGDYDQLVQLMCVCVCLWVCECVCLWCLLTCDVVSRR